jgi:hypothetical protein
VSGRVIVEAFMEKRMARWRDVIGHGTNGGGSFSARRR